MRWYADNMCLEMVVEGRNKKRLLRLDAHVYLRTFEDELRKTLEPIATLSAQRRREVEQMLRVLAQCDVFRPDYAPDSDRE
jgi:hypothetical protein